MIRRTSSPMPYTASSAAATPAASAKGQIRIHTRIARSTFPLQCAQARRETQSDDDKNQTSRDPCRLAWQVAGRAPWLFANKQVNHALDILPNSGVH
jgi:hypothetical protein